MWGDKWGRGRCTLEAHSGRLSFGPKQFRLQTVQSSMPRSALSYLSWTKTLKIGLLSRLFSRFVFLREISTPELKTYIHTLLHLWIRSVPLRKTDNVASVSLDDFGHFLSRFLRNFAEQFFKSGNFTAKQILKHSTFPRLFPRIFVSKGTIQMRFS